MPGPIVASLHVPPTDSPDDVTRFVAELNRLLGPEAGLRAELDVIGSKRVLHLRRVDASAPLQR